MEMATGNNIKNFSAADIERYHKGLLSSKERHDLEKAALDDPFLADALEGYTVAGNDAALHLADLRTKLATRTEGIKLVPIKEKKKKPLAWLRIAALLVVIAGAAYLTSQFVFKNKDKGIAKTEKKSTEATAPTDTTGNTTAGLTNENDVVKNGTAVKTETGTNDGGNTKPTVTVTVDETSGKVATKNLQDIDGIKKEDIAVKPNPVSVTTNPAGTINPPPATAGADDKTAYRNDVVKEKVKDNKDVTAERKVDADKNAGKYYEDGPGAVTMQKRNEAATTTRRAANDNAGSGYVNRSNTFRGRVTDANNVGVPFANVTNAQDNNAGTYTDAKGYFNLTYPDSVLTVQVRSIGFENSNVQLRNTVPSNQVVLQDDRRSLSEVVISNQKPNAELRNRNIAMNVKLEEPEPADGWENYDTYLANNLNAPEEITTKQNGGGQVQVSFEVNKEGEPVNIKIEKSLCSKCDKEAIRLIKEGPKWKRNANKKGRTTVTINF